jgi:hypothetical protein
MGKKCQLAVAAVAFLSLLCLPALADSHSSFSNEKLTGASGSTLSGSFTFTGNASGGTFSHISLQFNGGAFNGVNASSNGGKATCLLGICGISFRTRASNDQWVWDTILLNVNTGKYTDLGKIHNWKNGWNFDPPGMSVPEGGTSLAYLVVSGLAVFAGIVISGKRRRHLHVA